MPVTRQLHVWISETDEAFLRDIAMRREVSVGSVVRQLIRVSRRQLSGINANTVPGSTTTGHIQPSHPMDNKCVVNCRQKKNEGGDAFIVINRCRGLSAVHAHAVY